MECAREQADLAGELAEREAELAAVSAQAAEREAAAGAAAQATSDAERRLQVLLADSACVPVEWCSGWGRGRACQPIQPFMPAMMLPLGQRSGTPIDSNLYLAKFWAPVP